MIIDRKALLITFIICGALLLLIGLQMVKIQENAVKIPRPMVLTYVTNSITPQMYMPYIEVGDLLNVEE